VNDQLDQITYTYPVVGQENVEAVYYYENTEANRDKTPSELRDEPKLQSSWTSTVSTL